VAKLIETKIAEMLDGGEPLAWAIRKDGRMKVIAHDGREYWFEASEVAAARAAIERGAAWSSKNELLRVCKEHKLHAVTETSDPAPEPGTAPLPDPEPGTAPGNKPKPATAAKIKPATAARRSSSKNRRSSSKK
jgi:hypothetical protein